MLSCFRAKRGLRPAATVAPTRSWTRRLIVQQQISEARVCPTALRGWFVNAAIRQFDGLGRGIR
jgi:hypothetical protein